METPKYHEIIRPLRELGGMVIDLIVPSRALELPERGAEAMLSRNPGEVGAVPAQPTLWD